MLPEFRFACAAIVLAVSLVIFGLGAAALLRASHQQFASLPPLRQAPGGGFTHPTDVPPATLSMLRAAAPEPAAVSSETSVASTETVVSSTPALPVEVSAPVGVLSDPLPEPQQTLTLSAPPDAVSPEPAQPSVAAEVSAAASSEVAPAPQPALAELPPAAGPDTPAAALPASAPAIVEPPAEAPPPLPVEIANTAAVLPDEPAPFPPTRETASSEARPSQLAALAEAPMAAPARAKVVPKPRPKPKPVLRKRVVAKPVVKRRSPAPRPRVVRAAPGPAANPFGAPFGQTFGTPFGR